MAATATEECLPETAAAVDLATVAWLCISTMRGCLAKYNDVHEKIAGIFADAGTVSYFLYRGQDCLAERNSRRTHRNLSQVRVKFIGYLLVLPHRAGLYGALPIFPFRPVCSHSQAEWRPKDPGKPAAAL